MLYITISYGNVLQNEIRNKSERSTAMDDSNVNYKEMYLELMRATEKAINILIQAQRDCEEKYISESEDGTAE